MNNVLYGIGIALIDFDINTCIVGRALPGVEHKWQHKPNGQRQLLRSSPVTGFILPLVACIARVWAGAAIILFGVERNISCEFVFVSKS